MGLRPPGSRPLRSLIWVAAIGIFCALTYWRVAQKESPRDSEATQELNAEMEASADRAVDMAKSYGVSLDYAPASIDGVDSLLDQIGKDWAFQKSDFELDLLATMYGAYVGEVIRRGVPRAYWGKDHPSAGPNSYPLYWGAGQACSFPVSWCLQRIRHRGQESVAREFRRVEAQLPSKTRP